MTIWFALLWAFIGAFFGVLATAIAAAAHDTDEYERGYFAGYRKAGGE